jgi:hypothetical protein
VINSDALDRLTLESGSYAQRAGTRTGAWLDFSLRDGSRKQFSMRGAASVTNASVLAEGPVAEGRGSWLITGRQSYLNWLLHRIDSETDASAGSPAMPAHVRACAAHLAGLTFDPAESGRAGRVFDADERGARWSMAAGDVAERTGRREGRRRTVSAVSRVRPGARRIRQSFVGGGARASSRRGDRDGLPRPAMAGIRLSPARARYGPPRGLRATRRATRNRRG